MNPTEFTYWLKGWIELEKPTTVSEEQLAVIKEHLKLAIPQAPRSTLTLGELAFPTDPTTKIC